MPPGYDKGRRGDATSEARQSQVLLGRHLPSTKREREGETESERERERESERLRAQSEQKEKKEATAEDEKTDNARLRGLGWWRELYRVSFRVGFLSLSLSLSRLSFCAFCLSSFGLAKRTAPARRPFLCPELPEPSHPSNFPTLKLVALVMLHCSVGKRLRNKRVVVAGTVHQYRTQSGCYSSCAKPLLWDSRDCSCVQSQIVELAGLLTNSRNVRFDVLLGMSCVCVGSHAPVPHVNFPHCPRSERFGHAQ